MPTETHPMLVPYEDERPDYETKFPVSEWSYDECCIWLWNEGAWTCGDNGGYALGCVEECREEVLLQGAEIGFPFVGGNPND